MNFLKTSMLSGISTIIKILSSLVINKIIAIYIGPVGIALIGQFQNIIGILTTAGSGAINSGVTKYVAEYHDKRQEKNEFLNAGLIIMITSSLIIGFITFIFSNFLSIHYFNSNNLSNVFKILAITMVFISLNSFLLALLNGLKKIKSLIIANILGSILSLFVTSVLTIKFYLYGSLLSTVIIQSIVLLITLYFIYKSRAFSQFKVNFKVSKDTYKNLFKFALMALVTVATVPVVQIGIRSSIIKNFSVEDAGYWQAVWKISDMYLLVLITAFSTYYLPRLSELKTKKELKAEIISGYKIIIPFVLISAFGIYLLRDFIIWLLFTPEFKIIKPLFTFQLIGDFFKMCSWTLSFLMVAKAMTKIYIITEIIFSISFYIFSSIFMNIYGTMGVTIAYALNYFLYLLLMLFVFRDILFKTERILLDDKT